MNLFLTILFSDVCAVKLSDIKEPVAERQAGDREIGVMPDALKPFYTVVYNRISEHRRLHNEVEETRARHKRHGARGEQKARAEFLAEAFLSGERLETVERLFTQELREYFSTKTVLFDEGEWLRLEQDTQLLVLKDWIVVSRPIIAC